MAVSLVKRRANVLKLVCPGGAVEVHRKPITAAEVMSRKPRHFVTRPTVFEYPWVVVRPELVLEPGEVFYVVPARTIYRLLQLKQYHSHDRNAYLRQGNYIWSCSGDSPCMMKRGNNHDCEKTEMCNLGEHDRGNALSDSAAAHLSNVLAPKRHCRDSMESSRHIEREQSQRHTASSSKEVTLSHHMIRQLSLNNTAKRWSDYKQTWVQKLSRYDSSSFEARLMNVGARQRDKGSLKSASLISHISKLPLESINLMASRISKCLISSQRHNYFIPI